MRPAERLHSSHLPDTILRGASHLQTRNSDRSYAEPTRPSAIGLSTPETRGSPHRMVCPRTNHRTRTCTKASMLGHEKAGAQRTRLFCPRANRTVCWIGKAPGTPVGSCPRTNEPGDASDAGDCLPGAPTRGLGHCLLPTRLTLYRKASSARPISVAAAMGRTRLSTDKSRYDQIAVIRQPGIINHGPAAIVRGQTPRNAPSRRKLLHASSPPDATSKGSYLNRIPAMPALTHTGTRPACPRTNLGNPRSRF